jgi:hypothetical protein
MRTLRTLALAACALSSLACSTETTFTDVGSVCVSGTPGGSHNVEVDFHECLSSSCDTVVESSCAVTQDGNTLTITATAIVERKNGACTEDCGQLAAECETDPLPAGNYQVVYGEVQGTLTVPPINPDEPTCFSQE